MVNHVMRLWTTKLNFDVEEENVKWIWTTLFFQFKKTWFQRCMKLVI